MKDDTNEGFKSKYQVSLTGWSLKTAIVVKGDDISPFGCSLLDLCYESAVIEVVSVGDDGVLRVIWATCMKSSLNGGQVCLALPRRFVCRGPGICLYALTMSDGIIAQVIQLADVVRTKSQTSFRLSFVLMANLRA
jgi:hypothetical protein